MAKGLKQIDKPKRGKGREGGGIARRKKVCKERLGKGALGEAASSSRGGQLGAAILYHHFYK